MWLNRSIGSSRIGLLLVYLSFFAMIAPAILAARFHFSEGYWFLAIWSLGSIAIVPKAVAGLVLLIGRESTLWLGMSFLLHKLYPTTMARRRSEENKFGETPIWFAYLRELSWLAIGLFPVAQWIA